MRQRLTRPTSRCHVALAALGLLLGLAPGRADATGWASIVGPLASEASYDVTPDGGVVGLAFAGCPPWGDCDYLVFRLDQAGELAWARRFVGVAVGSWPPSPAPVVTSDGGVLLAFLQQGYAPAIVRLDSDGAVEWAISLDFGSFGCQPWALDAWPDGDAVALFACNNHPAALVRLAPDGSVRWSLEATAGDTHVVAASDGSTYLATGGDYGGLWATRLDPDGFPEWSTSVPVACRGLFSPLNTLASACEAPGGQGLLLCGYHEMCFHSQGFPDEPPAAWIALVGSDGQWTGWLRLPDATFAGAIVAADDRVVAITGDLVLETDATLQPRRAWRQDPATTLGGLVAERDVGWMLHGASGTSAFVGRADPLGDPAGCGLTVAPLVTHEHWWTEGPQPFTFSVIPVTVVSSPASIDVSDDVLASTSCLVPPVAPPRSLQVRLRGGLPVLSWTAVAGATSHAVFAGSIASLQLGTYDHRRASSDGSACSIAGLSYAVPADFAEDAYYLVAGVNVAGMGTLGFDSEGVERPAVACP